jgi:uncharacterized repeat protein (TIGR03803 family)
VVAASFLAAAAKAQSYDVLYVFGTDSAAPYAGLIQGTDGNLYGTTLSCGASSGYGTIFKIDTAGTNFSILFTSESDGQNPYGLMRGTDGNFYGTTIWAFGTGNAGTIFKIDAAGTTLTILHSFTGSDGGQPNAGLIQGTDGNLYGTTLLGGPNSAINAGTIFKIDPSGTAFTSLYAFTGASDGDYPRAGLIQGTDGNLYGTTGGDDLGINGTIFKIDTAGATLTTLHSFTGSDGASPYAPLIQGTDGNLYGTTYAGGASNDGTIFKIDTAGATLTTLHSFTGSDGANSQASLIQAADGNLYGTTVAGGASNNGTIFKIDTAGTTLITLHSFTGSDGAQPTAGLIQATSGNFYGSTEGGGLPGGGTIFKIDTAGSTLTTLHIFTGIDGAIPYAGVIQGADGSLYGTTSGGGASGNGTIFKIDAGGAKLITLHAFTGSDGAQTNSGLIQGADGNLYGTTAAGGSSNVGTIFKIDTAGTELTTLHSFTGSDGGYPYAGLIQGTDGYLYGTTRSDGAGGVGTIFKIDTAGVTLTTLHTFTGSDGAHPFGSLVQGTDGNLYGTTHHGGASDNGTIFKIDTAGVTLTTLHSFTDSDGANPVAGLIQATDGNLYGTTEDGGASGGGTIFKIDTAGTTLTTLHSFTGSDGWEVSEGLIQGSDGNLYGTTEVGGANCGSLGGCGTIFKIDTSGANFTVLHSFDSADGQNPNGLIQAADGKLYGTTNYGATQAGVAFRLAVCAVNDVLPTDPFYPFVCMILGDGITAGCGGGDYCPNDPVTRAQMAAFLLKAKHGRGYLPPICTGIFQDVACPGAFAVNWIEDLYNETITAGCSVNPLLYCPTSPVTRAQMAVFLLKSKHGSSYQPPACTGIFQDVACPSESANWIEELYHEGITGGCSSNPLDYCPDAIVNRGQMAVLLAKTFGLL